MRGAVEEKCLDPITKIERTTTLSAMVLYLWKRPEALLLMLAFGSANIVSFSVFY